jgi:hypothetical protein
VVSYCEDGDKTPGFIKSVNIFLPAERLAAIQE